MEKELFRQDGFKGFINLPLYTMIRSIFLHQKNFSKKSPNLIRFFGFLYPVLGDHYNPRVFLRILKLEKFWNNSQNDKDLANAFGAKLETIFYPSTQIEIPNPSRTHANSPRDEKKDLRDALIDRQEFMKALALTNPKSAPGLDK
ncbi:hypothetical protein BpHYR1_029926, partial [Brachionus plicatilis]